MAETFTDVVNRFDVAVEELATALNGPFANETVSFPSEYRQFAATYVDRMRDVQEHGSRLSGNVQLGAVEVARTDDRAAEDYRRFGEPVPEPSEPSVEGHQTYISQQLNEHIDSRYVPEVE
ncbi:hypothetical protein J4H86_09260 [Spiractinospora alimapuensis]|uniref:hypothetical protein n=1 Tax=Spiractinospora alimapuensis TaxID=2820884 RepID=UPI001F206A35|nr:hypothetical protein [Spiractinospora alimapuensis]QVQ53875.1 hypothetical protein J4H86_09260 [Spiractinospora alimapuensis]